MSGDENLNKYQFHRSTERFSGHDPRHDLEFHTYDAYRGEERVGNMGVRKEAGTHTITDLGVDQSHRHLIKPLIGLAVDVADQAGAKLKPSDNLSAHSLPLVEKLRERGLVTGPRTLSNSRVGNRLDFEHPSVKAKVVPPAEREGRRLNTETVQSGKQALQRKLKGAKRL